ncbi:MAG: L-threonylcarbamoyladenylate synthase [Flammeovirgaceae bacterium]
MAEIGKSILKAQQLLQAGELVAIPTETVYGLAGNGFNPTAVAQIFKVKNRPSFDPLILHTSSLDKVKRFVREFPEKAAQLAEAFWPGPLTLLLPKSAQVHDIVTSGLDTVAVRIPKHPMTLAVLSGLDFPVAAPSANPFSYISPTRAVHVNQHLGDQIPYILDGGNCQVGIESTIVGFPDGVPTIFRKGGTSLEAIERVIGKVDVRSHSSSQPQAPGMLKKHYSPKVPILIGAIPELLTQQHGKSVGVISFTEDYLGKSELQFTLSAKGDYSEAAQNLFAALRALDALQPDVILVELLPEEDLGIAINDRLRRAAAQ